VSGLAVFSGMMLMVFRTTTSDWLAWETAREPLERAIPAF